MVFLIKYSCACVGVNKLSDLTTCTVQIQSIYCIMSRLIDRMSFRLDKVTFRRNGLRSW